MDMLFARFYVALFKALSECFFCLCISKWYSATGRNLPLSITKHFNGVTTKYVSDNSGGKKCRLIAKKIKEAIFLFEAVGRIL